MALSDRIRPDCEAAPWVIKEVKELEAELASEERWSEQYFRETEMLKVKLAKAREALEFYADSNNWHQGYDYCWIDGSDEIRDIGNITAGRRAREALKEIGE